MLSMQIGQYSRVTFHNFFSVTASGEGLRKEHGSIPRSREAMALGAALSYQDSYKDQE
ncbi:MAG: hypothetical protein HPY52_15105 [Firmicutes bacterium]|nr:hypothetical protein [Bacillota bacterium]